jgi:hypothetical protein
MSDATLNTTGVHTCGHVIATVYVQLGR